MKKRGIFETCIKSNFYVRHYSNTGTKLQRGRTGESPAVISMLDIDLVHSDPLLFISPNSFKMCTKNDRQVAYSRPFYLYVLKDPFTLEIRYIGITNNPKKRERDHRTSFAPSMYGNNNAIINWKEMLRVNGAVPIFEIIKRFSTYEAAHRMENILINSLSENTFNVSGKKTVSR